MSKIHIRALLAIVFALFLIGWTHAALSQSFYGSILGTVSDPSGAVLPEAHVKLRNLSTNDQQTADTDSNGTYRFLNLVPGRYTLEITKDGFERLTRSSVEVDVQAAVRIDAALPVGATTQSVVVNSQTPLLDTESGTVSQVIESQVVQDTPLNGRNVDNLIEMAPGVVPQTAAVAGTSANVNGGTASASNAWGNYQIGGGMANQNSFMFDGTTMNRADYNAAAIVPTQDAVQEFRVDSNNMTADSGRTAGGVINMSTKSGSNAFHGTVYDYVRNTAFDANAFFNKRNGVATPEFNQNQYGATLGGPLKKDKLFFFASAELLAYKLGGPTLLSVPTQAERTGNFSDPALPRIYDPLTVCGKYGNPACHVGSDGKPIYVRSQFPGNIIPANRLDPTANFLANSGWWSLPNTTANGTYTNNYTVNQHIESQGHQENARADYTVSDKQRAFAQYTFWHTFVGAGDPFGKGLVGTPFRWDATDAILGDTYAFSSKTIADLRVGYLRFINPGKSNGVGNYFSNFGPGWQTLASQVLFQGYPAFGVQGEYGPFTTNESTNSTNTYNVIGSVTQIAGRHSFKFGFDWRRIEWYYVNSGNADGSFTFDTGFTQQCPLGNSSAEPCPTGTATSGVGMASFLLGFPSSGTASYNVAASQYEYYAAMYAQDSYKVTNKLQFIYGIRWDLSPGQWQEKNSKVSVFVPTGTNPLSGSGGASLTGSVQLTNGASLHPSKRDLVAPRVGVTYLLTPHTVLRSGYSILYLPSDVVANDAPWNTSANSGLTTVVATLDAGVTPAATYSNNGQSAGVFSYPFPNGIVHASGNNATALYTATEGGSVVDPIAATPFPNQQQWNLSLENQSVLGILIAVDYVGAKGTHLPMNGNPQLNQLADAFDANGTSLTTQVTNPFYGFLPTSAGALATSSTVAAGQLLLPHPQYQSIMNPGYYAGSSSYNALEVRAERRFGSAGVLGGNFTWAKFISNTDSLTSYLGTPGTVQDWYNLRAERSIESYDVPTRAVIRYVLPLPFGKGARYASNVSGLVDHLISGWSVDGVTTFQAGFPMTFTSTGTSLSNNFHAGTPRPNIIAGCQLRIAGTPVSKLNKWFNTACFTAPSQFGFGNAPRVYGGVRSEGIDNFDISLSKRTALTPRVNFELRGEAYNALNHPQFNPPATQYGSSTFGVVSGAIGSQANSARILQVAGRFTF